MEMIFGSLIQSHIDIAREVSSLAANVATHKLKGREDATRSKTKCERAATSNEEFVFKLSSRLDAPASLWSLRKGFRIPN